MYAFPFTFTMDASGSPDAIVLPQDFPSGVRSLILKPPVGHAWNFYGPGATVKHVLATDEPLPLGPIYVAAGETIGFGELDSGSGTGRGIAS